jgi:15-cis-phytoene desaturase
VAILGGGVAGLSAAHELAERDFGVTVYEKRTVCGGKSRSIPKPGTATPGRMDLPGEHGFRFFPSFYRHIVDTLDRIPGPLGRPVSSHLVSARETMIALNGKRPIRVPARLPEEAEDWSTAFQLVFEGIGVREDELLFFVSRLLKLATSCPERRISDYERRSWWDFIHAEERSETYQKLLGEGLTRSLVAMRARQGSARTVGYILLQLLYGFFSPTGFDRVLTGPTSEIWLQPWIAHLSGKGVRFVNGAHTREIRTDASRVTAAIVDTAAGREEISSDYYICALPIEVIAPLVTDALAKLAPSLEKLRALVKSIEWMNGIQFFLKEDLPLNPGHTSYADSKWAITSISQKQFWNDAPLDRYGDGSIRGILSVDISDWNTPGVLFGKTAKECTADEIRQEVWSQLKAHLNVDGAVLLRDENVADWSLDPDIEQSPNPRGARVNAEPLLINEAGTLHLRPHSATEIENLFLASDYVRTNTDLACMEGANEAARAAVNGILARSGWPGPRARIWRLEEPAVFAPLIELDRLAFLVEHPILGPHVGQ